MANKRKRRSRMTAEKQRKNGTVYVVKIEIDNEVVYKVGATSGNVRRRVLQVIESIEQEYDYFPRCELIMDGKCKNYYQVEKDIHKRLSDYKFECSSKFSGSTEIFKCDLDTILDIYKDVISRDEEAEDNLMIW